MREKPTTNQMKAREMFLDCHKYKICHDYSLRSSNLEFDDEITEVLLNGDYAFKKVFEIFQDKNKSDKIERIRSNTRESLVQALESCEQNPHHIWGKHMDYESLIMDKLVDLSQIPLELLTVTDGRSFFLMNRMYSLMHQGFQLSRFQPKHPQAQWFSRWDDTWFTSRCLTKYRLIDILKEYDSNIVEDFSIRNSPEEENLDKTYEKMRDLKVDMMHAAIKSLREYSSFRKDHPSMNSYLNFVESALKYNEDLRLLRSQAVFKFITLCYKKYLNPYGEFINHLAQRKEKIQEMYKK